MVGIVGVVAVDLIVRHAAAAVRVLREVALDDWRATAVRFQYHLLVAQVAAEPSRRVDRRILPQAASIRVVVLRDLTLLLDVAAAVVAARVTRAVACARTAARRLTTGRRLSLLTLLLAARRVGLSLSILALRALLTLLLALSVLRLSLLSLLSLLTALTVGGLLPLLRLSLLLSLLLGRLTLLSLLPLLLLLARL